jgi:cold-inducible RNA-binding protein
MGRKLFVGNFPYETGEAELEALFSQAGAIDTVRVMRDMSTGRARGFAFVEMQSEDDALAAIQKFNGTDMGGRALVVNEAKPKPAFSGGGGGGGRDGGQGPRRRSEPRW